MVGFTVIIPALDEEKRIANAIEETSRVFSLFGKTFEIIIVDDGSTDKTADVVESIVVAQRVAPLRLISHDRNKGKGAAIKTGAAAARGEWILFLDSDLATHPSEFEKFLPYLSDYDVLIASRRVAGAKIAERQPLYRTWLGRLFNLCVRLYFGLPYHDTQCGFKAFRRNAIPLVTCLETDGWAFDVELLHRARLSNLRVKEIPVVWRHGTESRVRLKHFWTIAGDLRRIKRRFSSSHF
ncbi:MAG: glycosyltransferase family 2 protein [Patescibacteria group bacterium]|nr:glycosyltransferase family 2 protein [Patescibacteria group bacterium]